MERREFEKIKDKTVGHALIHSISYEDLVEMANGYAKALDEGNSIALAKSKVGVRGSKQVLCMMESFEVVKVAKANYKERIWKNSRGFVEHQLSSKTGGNYAFQIPISESKIR